MVPLFLCAFLLFSCQKSPELQLSPQAAQFTVAKLNHGDREIALIADDARNTLPGFFRHLSRGSASSANGAYFCVKYPFIADEDSGVNMEQVWLSDIHFKNGIHYGIIANTPRHLSGMKKGDKVIFEMDGVTDWMYIREGKIIGGDSIKYLLEKTPEEQRGDRERELLQMLH